MIQYLRALSASLLMGCSMWDFSDCKITEIGYCVWNGRSPRVEEKMWTRAKLIHDLAPEPPQPSGYTILGNRRQAYEGSNYASDFGYEHPLYIACAQNEYARQALNDSWLEAHTGFTQEFPKSRIYNTKTLTEKLDLSSGFITCIRVDGRKIDDITENL